MKRIKRTFSADFKLEAAQLVTEQNYTIKDAAEAMGVGKSTMDKWVRQLRQEYSGISLNAKPISPEQRKIRELEARIKKLEREKDILKKATALLMSDEMNGFR